MSGSAHRGEGLLQVTVRAFMNDFGTNILTFLRLFPPR